MVMDAVGCNWMLLDDAECWWMPLDAVVRSWMVLDAAGWLLRLAILCKSWANLHNKRCQLT